MSFDGLAQSEFEDALRQSFWRGILSWVSGQSNDLLPFDAIRENLPVQGQHYRGLQIIPVEKIIGSVGRYRDFDRAFLPRNANMRQRWVAIDKAFRTQKPLPPIEVYRVGEVYFVKDGNHRVSVARQRGQESIDAYVTEMEVGIPITPSLTLDDLEFKREQAAFYQETGLRKMFPDLEFALTLKGEFSRLSEHIRVHRWYMGEAQGKEVPFPDAVRSWVENVYRPVLAVVQRHHLTALFAGRTPTDLYLWLSEYQWYLREAYQQDTSVKQALNEAQAYLHEQLPNSDAGHLKRMMRRAPWLDELICGLEQGSFLERTRIQEIRPQSDVRLTLPGKYEIILGHIAVHRWYLGEQTGAEVSTDDAVASWYDHVYLPLIQAIQKLDILKSFPDRTPADLYVWVMARREALHRSLGWELTPERVAMALIEGEHPFDRENRRWWVWLAHKLTAGWERGPKPGVWRKHKQAAGQEGKIFGEVLVALDGEAKSWVAFEQAAVVAQKENGHLFGLHVTPPNSGAAFPAAADLQEKFLHHCAEKGLEGSLAFAKGKVSRQICRHASLVDLVVFNLAYSPPPGPMGKWGYGTRTLIHRCSRPLLVTPGVIAPLDRALLAYDGSPKSDEALYLARRLAQRWNIDLLVLSVVEGEDQVLGKAHRYLDSHQITARYLKRPGPVGQAILEVAGARACDFIILGGYGFRPIVEMMLGSALDTLLRETRIPLLLSR